MINKKAERRIVNAIESNNREVQKKVRTWQQEKLNEFG